VNVTGKELRQIREEWGPTQVELATLLGCHPQTVSEMERGKKHISQAIENLVGKEKTLRAIKKIVSTSS
jgi:DNA-binding XRE family transcriptional regulator